MTFMGCYLSGERNLFGQRHMFQMMVALRVVVQAAMNAEEQSSLEITYLTGQGSGWRL